jgi:hypothetical protein
MHEYFWSYNRLAEQFIEIKIVCCQEINRGSLKSGGPLELIISNNEKLGLHT